MTAADDRHRLPPGLPVPADDGACDHMPGLRVPSLELEATIGGTIDLADLASTLAVLYVYPRAGQPGSPAPPSEWNAIPGARGCTLQSCGFRDHHPELAALDALVAGLSVRPLAEQVAFAEAERLPFPLLSDPRLRLGAALGLPTFEYRWMRLYRRLALVLERGSIAHVFYPVFPPDRNAADVLDWLRTRLGSTAPPGGSG